MSILMSLCVAALAALWASTEASCPAAKPTGPLPIRVVAFIDPSILPLFQNNKQKAETYIRARYAGATKAYAEQAVKFQMNVVGVQWLPKQKPQPLQGETCFGRSAMVPPRLASAFAKTYGGVITEGKADKVDWWTGFTQKDLVRGSNGVGNIYSMCTPDSASVYFVTKGLLKKQQKFRLLDRTVAHETGHVLGWHHDNPKPAPAGNGCPEQPKDAKTIFLMQAGSTTGRVSECTERERDATLGCLGCLLGTAARPPPPAPGRMESKKC